MIGNLNAYKAANLYKFFPAEKARSILRRLEIYYTPKHGRWLNSAESELNVLTRQHLNRRIPTVEELQSELAFWEKERNQMKAVVNWQFRTPNVRTKLISLYPRL